MTLEMSSIEVNWMGTLPSGWRLTRLKSATRITLGKMLSPEKSDRNPTELPYVRAANLSDTSALADIDLKRMWFSSREAKTLALRIGDVLITEGGSIGQPVYVEKIRTNEPICFQNSINRLRSGENQKFLFYWMKFLFDSGFHQNNTNTVSIAHLTREKLAEVPIYLPPRTAQRLIADWLDLQCNRIDKRLELLDTKRQLLRKLKKSVIEESSFRGLNKHVVMRDSEVEWLGSVPIHWNTVRLGSLFREAADAGIDGLPMLSVSIHSGISDKELADEELVRKVSRSEDRTLYKRVKPGDLVYNQMRAWQGAFGAAKIKGLVSPAYVVARPRNTVVPGFIEHLLRAPAAMEEIRRRSRGITDFRLRLYWNEFKNIRISLPPLNEQIEIAAFLDRKLLQIDRQIAFIDQLEELLKGQRKAIIHEAVTGKVDLSEHKPLQPTLVA